MCSNLGDVVRGRIRRFSAIPSGRMAWNCPSGVVPGGANLPRVKESYAARFADLLEGIAARVRSLTVGRLDRGITLTAFGIAAVVLVVAALVLVSVALFRLLAIATGTTGAYAAFGGLFLVAGWLLWRKGRQVPEESPPGESE